MLCLAIAFAWQSYGRAALWTSEGLLLADAIRHYPEGPSAHYAKAREALDRLRNVVGRLESSWRPATAEEGFEIVRRRAGPLGRIRGASTPTPATAFTPLVGRIPTNGDCTTSLATPSLTKCERPG